MMMSDLDKENKNNDEQDNNLYKKEKEKEIETQKSRKSIIFNNIILKNKPVKRNSIFSEFLNQSKVQTNERYNKNNKHEHDDVLVVQYLSNSQSSNNSNDINADNIINDNYDLNKTESNIDDDENKDRKKLGISVHNIHKKNNKEKTDKFEKDRFDDLNDINYKNATLNLGENKSRKSKGNLLQNKLNKNIKVNSPEKKNSNLLYSISPQKRKISFNDHPKFEYSNKSMIRSLHNRNKTLNINRMILFDDKNEINIEEHNDNDNNKGQENIESIIQLEMDNKAHNNKKKCNKVLKSKVKYDNMSQMVSTDILLLSNNDKK